MNLSAADTLAFSNNVDLLLQQMMSRLEQSVTVRDFTGEGAEDVKQVGSTELDEVLTIDGNTNYGSVSIDGRWLYPTAYDKAFLIDKISTLKTIASFENPLVNVLAAAAQRQIDRTLVNSYFATAKTGKQGATSTTFPAGQVVGVGVGGASATGLNPEKILAGLEILRANEALDSDGIVQDPVFCVVSPKQQTDLMRFVEMTSKDYGGGGAFSNGRIPQGWLGCNWIVSNRLLADANSYRRVAMYTKSGMVLGFWQRPTPEMFRDASKKNNWAAQIKMMLGATRREETKVVEIKCSEA